MLRGVRVRGAVSGGTEREAVLLLVRAVLLVVRAVGSDGGGGEGGGEGVVRVVAVRAVAWTVAATVRAARAGCGEGGGALVRREAAHL